MAKAGKNWASGVLPEEHEDFDKLLKCSFPWKLVLDEEEIENHWPKVVLPNTNPLVTTPIDLDFQIDEHSWTVPILKGIFYFSSFSNF